MSEPISSEANQLQQSNRGGSISFSALQKAPYEAKNYLMVIAIDDYEHVPRLYNCANDAQDLIETLTEYYPFEREHISFICGGSYHDKFRDIVVKPDPLLEITEIRNQIDGLKTEFSGLIEKLQVIDEQHINAFDSSDESRESLCQAIEKLIKENSPQAFDKFAYAQQLKEELKKQDLDSIFDHFIQEAPDITEEDSPISEVEKKEYNSYIWKVLHRLEFKVTQEKFNNTEIQDKEDVRQKMLELFSEAVKETTEEFPELKAQISITHREGEGTQEAKSAWEAEIWGLAEEGLGELIEQEPHIQKVLSQIIEKAKKQDDDSSETEAKVQETEANTEGTEAVESSQSKDSNLKGLRLLFSLQKKALKDFLEKDDALNENVIPQLKKLLNLIRYPRKVATREVITDELFDLVKKINKEVDELEKNKSGKKINLILCFSGHGEYDKELDLGYWIPVDAQANEYSKYISNNAIKELLRGLKTHHTLLLIDSCFSGSFFYDGATRSIAKDRLETKPSRWGITAGREEVVSDGLPGENSPFMRAVIRELMQTDAIGVQQLAINVIEKVATDGKQTPRGEPLRIKGNSGGQFIFRKKQDAKRFFQAGLLLMQLAELKPEYDRYRSAARQFYKARQFVREENEDQLFQYAWWEAKALARSGLTTLAKESLESALKQIQNDKYQSLIQEYLEALSILPKDTMSEKYKKEPAR